MSDFTSRFQVLTIPPIVLVREDKSVDDQWALDYRVEYQNNGRGTHE